MNPATSFTSLITEKTQGETGSLGGRVIRQLAAGTLLIGDVVYVSAADTVAKSTTNANYAGFAGVVVGGDSYATDGSICSDSTIVGATAATVGQAVLVQIDGIAYIKSDGAILAGSLVIPDASVAGECDVAGANPGYTLGVSLVAAADGIVGRMLIRHSYNEA
jgi:hypothetical protein